MDKKIISMVILLALIGSAILAHAEWSEGPITSNVHLFKGWNLVSFNTFDDDDWFMNTEKLKNMGIRAAYLYDPYNKDYLRLFPDYDNVKAERLLDNLESEGQEYTLFNMAIWIYSDKEQDVQFSTRGLESVSKMVLKTGWNFVAFTNEFNQADATFNDFKGDCAIQRIYGYHSPEGWYEFPMNSHLAFPEALWQGVVIKVADRCSLGKSAIVPSVPQLPDGAADYVKIEDYILAHDIDTIGDPKDITYLSSAVKSADCPLGLGGMCRFFSGKYSYDGELEFIVVPYEMSVSTFVDAAQSVFPSSGGGLLSQEDWMGEDYYIYIQGDDLLIFWYSGGKMIFVEREPYDSTKENDFIEDFLTKYLEKYPSDLEWK